MLSFLALVVTFVVGGFTLIPLLLATFFGLLFYSSPTVHLPPGRRPAPLDTQDVTEEAELVTPIYRAGWLTVRRTYEPYLGPNDGTYVGMVVSGYRSFMDNRSRDARRAKVKDHFFAVLKQNILYLYDSEDQSDCWAAVEVSAHDVQLYPECEGPDGELFIKRNAIALSPRLPISDDTGKKERPDSLAAFHSATAETTNDLSPSQPLPYFLFAKVNTDKEDWYHSLVAASASLPPNSASALFDPDDMARLVDGIDSLPDSIPTRWLNAILGRIFLGVYKTSSVEDYLVSRIVRKLKRIKTPSMLSEIKVREVNIGSSAPFFSKPMLRDLTADGDASMELHLSYVGEMRITIETVATINLGQRFKPYSVRLVLAVVLKELEGTLMVKIKKPPSNRVWYGFTSMPRMVLAVEPVVSTRQIKWSLITSPIESRIREVILESMVVPHMDDFPFFNSKPFLHRGGIWSDALRKETNLAVPPEDSSTAIGQPDVVALEQEEEQATANQAPASSTTGTLTSAVASAVEDRLKPRRRRSSDGDRPSPNLMFSSPLTAEPDSTSGSKTPNVTAAPTATTSALSSFSLAAWKKDSPLSTPGGSGSSEKKRWFGTAGNGTAGTGVGEEASRLRDMLEKRAREREKEQEEQQNEQSEQVKQEKEKPPVLSALSLTAPKVNTPPPTSSSSSLSLADLVGPNSSFSSASTTSSGFVLPAPPPSPLRRTSTHQSAQSVGSTASLLSTWRTKAGDKEALAAGVAQAKDTMKRWGATWNSARAAAGRLPGEGEGPGTSPQQDFGKSLPISNEREASPSRSAPGYRDYRASKTSLSARSNGEYFPSSPSDAVPISASVGFAPAAALPTTALNMVVANSPPRAPAATGYKPATMMTLPGITNSERRKRVASDHIAATDVGLSTPAASTSPPTSIPTKREPPPVPPRAEILLDDKSGEGPRAPRDMPAIPPRPPPASSAAALDNVSASETAEPTSDSMLQEAPEIATEAAVETAAGLPASSPVEKGPIDEMSSASPQISLPEPQPVATKTVSAGDKSSSGSEPEETVTQSQNEEEADEAGWGLGAEEGEETAVDKK